MGGVCNDYVPIGWKLEVTLPLGRAGVVTERLKRTQSIWTLQKDRPKPKSQLYRLQARELPSTELVFAHQSALPPSPGGETETAGSPPAAGMHHPLVCNTTGAHGLAHPKIASCQQRHVPLCYLRLQAWPTPEPLSPRISLPLTPHAPGSLSCNTQSKPLTHTTPVAQAGVLTGGRGQKCVVSYKAEILPLTLRDAAWHYSGWSRTDVPCPVKDGTPLQSHNGSCQQLPLSWPSQCSPGRCPLPAQLWSTADHLLGWGPLLLPSAALPQHSPCLPHSPFILSHALVVVWKYKGHTFHRELFQILLTLTPRNSKAAAWSQGPGRTTQNVWAALSKS